MPVFRDSGFSAGADHLRHNWIADLTLTTVSVLLSLTQGMYIYTLQPMVLPVDAAWR